MVLDELARERRIKYKPDSKEHFYIYLKDPYKVAQDIYKWAFDAGKLNSLETFDFIATGD